VKDLDRLYGLLPPVFREVDASRQLQALMRIMQAPYDDLDALLGDMRQNWFVETCDTAGLTRIGDLLGVEGLQSGWREQRALVGDILAFRRRKGSPYVLQRFATALTGWQAAVATDPDLDRLASGLLPDEPPTGPIGPASKLDLTLWTKPLVQDRIAAAPMLTDETWPPARRFWFHASRRPVAARVSPWRPAPMDRPPPLGSMPVALTRRVLASDLNAADAFAEFASSSAPCLLYGPGRSLNLRRAAAEVRPQDGQNTFENVPPWDLWAGDLSGGELPPGACPVFLSAALDPFPKLRARAEFTLDLGAGPVRIVLSRRPTSLEDAAVLIETAIQASDDDVRHAQCRLITVAGGLAILPGLAAAAKARVTPTAKDADTAASLGFLAPRPYWVLRSGPDLPFDRLGASPAAVELTFGDAAATVVLQTPISNLQALAAAMTAALAVSDVRALSAAVCLAMGERLVVAPGSPVGRPRAEPLNPAGRALGLHCRIGIDPEIGLIVAEDDEGAVFDGVYVRAVSALLGSDAPHIEPPRGARIVTPTDLRDVLAETQSGQSSAIALEAGEMASGLALTLEAGQCLWLGASSEQAPTLRLIDGMRITAKGPAEIHLSGLLIEGPILIEGEAVSLTLDGVTLLPGPTPVAWGFSEPSQYPLTASLCFASETSAAVTLTRSIIGPIVVGNGVRPGGSITATDCVIFSDENGGPAIAGAPEPQTGTETTLRRGPGGAVSLRRVTVLGDVDTDRLVAVQDSLIMGSLSPLVPGTVETSAYLCADTDLFGNVDAAGAKISAAAWPDPTFGDLLSPTAATILTGAGDGGEMGVQNLLSNQRRCDLLAQQISGMLPIVHPPLRLIFADRTDPPWRIALGSPPPWPPGNTVSVESDAALEPGNTEPPSDR